MEILVTGGAGFIGSALKVNKLHKNNVDVLVRKAGYYNSNNKGFNN